MPSRGSAMRREGGIGGQHGCRPGAADAQVVHVHGGAHTELRAPAGFHILRMPEPAPGVRTVPWQLPARSSAEIQTGHGV